MLRRSVSSWTGQGARVAAVLGGQWGDEGKGKLVDVLAKQYDIVARFNGGANAGHTLVVDGTKFAFHLLPCGMLYPDKLNVIGNGVVLHVPTLFKELGQLTDKGIPVEGKLVISSRAHLLFDFHQTVDQIQEKRLSGKEIGTTKKGIGPCYASKATRNGIRVGDLVGDWQGFVAKYKHLLGYLQECHDFEYSHVEELEKLEVFRDKIQSYVSDTTVLINEAYHQGKTIIAEGANACLLDLDFGTYPYVTSSSTTAGGICTGLGIAPSKIESTVGVVKAYTTRVGGGPFPTELKDKIGDHFVEVGREFGTTTGRKRRCGWLDIPVVHYSNMINGYNSINITKLDVLDDLEEVKIGVAYKIGDRLLRQGEMPSTLDELAKVRVVYETMPGWKTSLAKCRRFEDLPFQAQNYINRIEELVEVPISWIGVGAARDDMVKKHF